MSSNTASVKQQHCTSEGRGQKKNLPTAQRNRFEGFDSKPTCSSFNNNTTCHQPPFTKVWGVDLWISTWMAEAVHLTVFWSKPWKLRPHPVSICQMLAKTSLLLGSKTLGMPQHAIINSFSETCFSAYLESWHDLISGCTAYSAEPSPRAPLFCKKMRKTTGLSPNASTEISRCQPWSQRILLIRRGRNKPLSKPLSPTATVTEVAKALLLSMWSNCSHAVQDGRAEDLSLFFCARRGSWRDWFKTLYFS